MNAQGNPEKHAFDANGRHRNVTMSGVQTALTSSHSDTSYEVKSCSDHKNAVTIDVICDHQKPPAKPADQELSESSSSIDYESLKAVVRNLIRNSNDDLERPAAEKVGHLVPDSSSNDTRPVSYTHLTLPTIYSV